MELSRKNRKLQAAIADALKKGLPLAGLLSSLMVTTGCDVVKGFMNRHTVGRIAPRPSAITTTEEGVEENLRLRQLPIIGIAVHPIPYVILADGQRMGTGSVVGGYTIKDISLTEVTLSNDNEQLIWRP